MRTDQSIIIDKMLAYMEMDADNKQAAWDETAESLKQAANLVDTDNPDEIIDSVFKRMTNYIL